jgi:toxin-antitoxin system PIN domain toxin
MSGVIDTNILLYAVNTDADEHKEALQFLTRAGNDSSQWYFTEGIIYEFLRVSTHSKVFSRPLSWKQSISFVKPLLLNDNFSLISAEDRHWNLLENTLKEITYPSGNLFFDIRTAVLMREHGIKYIYTTDTDFLQFTWIEVVNPLRS